MSQPSNPISSFFSSPVDLINSLISSIAQSFNSFVASVVSGIASSLQSLSSLGSQIAISISSGLSSVVNTFLNTIVSSFAAIPQSIVGLFSGVAQQLASFFTAIPQQIAASFAVIGQQFNAGVVLPIAQFFSNVGNQFGSFFNTAVQNLQRVIDQVSVTVQNIGASFATSFERIGASLQSVFAQFGTTLGSFSSYINTGLSNVGIGLTNFGNSISNALSGIGKQFVNDIGIFYNEDIKPVVDTVTGIFTNSLSSLFLNMYNMATQKLSNDPKVAVDQFLSKLGLLGTGIIGTLVGIKAIDNLHPFHSLQFEETFKHILEFVGVYDFSRESLKILVDNGIGLQAEYFANYFYQARKISKDAAKVAVWYGDRSVDQYKIDLRYEGLEDDAIASHVATLYKPMPTFILEKLIELQVIPNDFAVNQLAREGFDPKDMPQLIKGFQNMILQGFQSNVKSFIFTTFKSGYIDESTSRNIMTVFAIPKQQQDWILQIATLQFKFEQQLELQKLILDEVGKQVIKTPDDAIAQLVATGMDKARADILVKIKLVTSLPTLVKTQRQAFVGELAALGIGA